MNRIQLESLPIFHAPGRWPFRKGTLSVVDIPCGFWNNLFRFKEKVLRLQQTHH